MFYCFLWLMFSFFFCFLLQKTLWLLLPPLKEKSNKAFTVTLQPVLYSEKGALSLYLPLNCSSFRSQLRWHFHKKSLFDFPKQVKIPHVFVTFLCNNFCKIQFTCICLVILFFCLFHLLLSSLRVCVFIIYSKKLVILRSERKQILTVLHK